MAKKKSVDHSKSTLLTAKININKGRYDLALKDLAQSFEDNTGGDDIEHTIQLHFYRGKAFQKLKKKDKAFNCYKAARKLLEKNKEEHFFSKLKDLIDEAFLSFN